MVLEHREAAHTAVEVIHTAVKAAVCATLYHVGNR